MFVRVFLETRGVPSQGKSTVEDPETAGCWEMQEESCLCLRKKEPEISVEMECQESHDGANMSP